MERNMMKLLKRTSKHNIWEVWCEYTAESVYVDHRPIVSELEEIRRKNWPGSDRRGYPYELKVYKLTPFYTFYNGRGRDG